MFKSINRKSLLLFLYFFCVIAAFWTLKPLRTSSVVKAFGPDYYPLIKQGVVLLIPLILAGYAYLTCAMARGRLVLTITAGFLAADIALWALSNAYPSNTLKVMFFYYVDTYITVMVTLFWTYMNDVFEPEEAKQYYGFIGAGGLVGGIAGSMISGWASTILGDHILLAAGGFMLPIFFIISLLEKDRGPSDMRGVCESEHKSMSQVFTEGVSVVLRSKYMMGVVAVVGIYEIASTIVDYQFNAAVAGAFSSRTDMAGFQGKVFFFAQFASLAVQLLLTSFVHKRYGVLTGLFFLPVVLLAGTGSFLFFPILPAITLAIAGEASMAYSINQSSKEILYVPLDPISKYKGKAFIDMFVLRAAKTVGAMFLLAYTLWLRHRGVPAETLTVACILLILAWLYVIKALGTRPEYRALRN